MMMIWTWGIFVRIGATESLIVLLFSAGLLLTVVAWWQIFAKTGNSGWLGLLMLVPVANLVLLLYLAFSEWPIHGELRRLRGPGGDDRA